MRNHYTSALAFVVASAVTATPLLLRGQAPPAAAADAGPLDVAAIDRWMTELSNWNRWGREDERGTVNLIVPPPVYERCRAAVRAAPLVRARGKLERHEGTINVVVSEVVELDRSASDLRPVVPPGHSWGRRG